MRKFYVLKPFVYNGKQYKYGDIFDADALKVPEVKVNNRLKARMITLTNITKNKEVKAEEETPVTEEKVVEKQETSSDEQAVEINDALFADVPTANKKGKSK